MSEPMHAYFESLISGDADEIVLCNTEHQILYMNRAAVAVYGDLVGSSLLDCHNETSCEQIRRVVEWFRADAAHNRVHTFYNGKQNKDGYMIALRSADGQVIGYYEKHEFRTKDDTPFYAL